MVEILDPWAKPLEVKNEYGLDMINELNGRCYAAIILAVAHDKFKELNIDCLKQDSNCVIYDVKNYFIKNNVDGKL